jgi:hypothetical protein
MIGTPRTRINREADLLDGNLNIGLALGIN